MDAKRFVGMLCAIMLLTVALGLTCHAEETAKKVPIPGHGYLLLKVPSDWVMTVNQPPNEVPPTVIFAPNDSKRFKLSMTALWNPKSEKGFGTDELKPMIESERGRMAAGAKETRIEIKNIEGENSKGFYYSATDKSPKPGEYEYLTRAVVAVGNLLLSTTLLSHPENPKDVEMALRMLQSASQEK